MLAFIVANWELIVLIVLALLFVVFKTYQLLSTPSEKRQEMIKEWLVEAVTLAEEKYGSKTGDLKYAFVYQLFAKKYKWFSKFIPETLFAKLVDEALELMQDLSKESK